MKTTILLIAFLLGASAFAHAAEFTFRNSDVPDLIAALRALDGYDRAVDQGPGNPQRVVRENYTFSREVRAKLGANLTVLQNTAKKIAESVDAVRLEISGNAQALDEKDTVQMKLWNERVPKLMAREVKIELSPVTNDELKPGSATGENPIPISVLAILNALRPPVPEKK